MKFTRYTLLWFPLFLLACGKLEVGVETATPTPVLQQTIEAVVGTAVGAAQPTPIILPSVSLATTTPVTLPTETRVTETAVSSPIPTHAATATPRPPVATQPPAPQILSFTITPTQVNPGDSIVLTWQAVGADATLCLIFSSGYVHSCTEVPLQDSLVYTLDPSLRESFNFEIRVSARGQEAIFSNYVNVTCPATWWFFANPPAICPVAPPTTTNAAFETFERGFMIWFEDSDTIYVFFDSPNRPYIIFYDDMQHFITPTPNHEAPPPGLYEPTSGFGHIWRGEVPGSENVRQWLGWALEPEYNFTTTYQQDTASSYPVRYFSGPDEQIIALNVWGNTWYNWP